MTKSPIERRSKSIRLLLLFVLVAVACTSPTNDDTTTINESELYTDLGLPSGTLWKVSNEDGLFEFDTAVSLFGNHLPTKEQLTELKDKCQWRWNGNGHTVIGPNGDSIILPAAGARICHGEIRYEGLYGYYWSSTPYDSVEAWHLTFDSEEVGVPSVLRCDGYCVRLVKTSCEDHPQ